MERQLKEEEKILESVAEKKALMGVAELAKGIQYEDPIKTRYALFHFHFIFYWYSFLAIYWYVRTFMFKVPFKQVFCL